MIQHIFKIHYRRTTLFLAFSIAVVAGIALVRVGLQIHIAWVVLLMVTTILTYPKHSLLALISFTLLGLSVGSYRGSGFAVNIEDYRGLYDKKVILQGQAKTDAVYDDRAQLSFDLGEIKVIEPTNQDLVGVIAVKGFGESSINRNDTVQVEGKLSYTKGSKQARMSFAELQVLQHNDNVVERTKRNFVAGMYTALPEPEASFGLGLLIGQRSTLPESVSEMLKVVGLTHIIAVSGYNLTILVRASQRTFGKRSKYQALVASLTLIIGFLLITGLSASIVRASIVSFLGLLAWYFGRSFRPTLLIAVTAAITGLWYPIYVWSDIGWYLSFLAFFGVLVLAPLIILRIWKTTEPRAGGQIVIESLCAQILTAPLIMYIFGQTSLVGIIANVLVVPLVPFAMLFSAIAGLAGWWAPMISGWFSWPANWLLTYILDVANILSRVPHALVKTSINTYQLVFLYSIILMISIVLYQKTRGGILKRHGRTF